MSDAARSSFGALVKAALDEALVARGFAAGQTGEPSDHPFVAEQVICCADPPSLARWHSVLPHIDDVPMGGCFDLVLDGCAARGIESVRLEGVELRALVDHLPTFTGNLAADLASLRDRLTSLLPLDPAPAG